MNALDDIEKFEVYNEKVFGAFGYPVPYTHKKMAELARALLAMCPVQPGDLAVITDPPVITKEGSPGWFSSKHLFTVGREIEVVQVDYYNGQFIIGFKFAQESHYSDFTKDMVQVDHERRGIYSMGARRVTKLPYQEPAPKDNDAALIFEDVFSSRGDARQVQKKKLVSMFTLAEISRAAVSMFQEKGNQDRMALLEQILCEQLEQQA